ncbi:MAG: glycosyltransferase family 9 protein [Calditrichaeota bacterium]|nr:glycosyltransferase family 9 protein [Calditrichota bacterium]
MKKPLSFLIVQLGRLGDLILMTPMFQAIKKNYPDSKITVLCGRNNYSFLSDYPLVDEILVHWKKPLRFLQLLKTLKTTHFDYWIDPKDHFSRESHFFAAKANADHKIGFNIEKKHSFDIPLKSQDEQYDMLVVDRNLAALSTLNIDMSDNRPKLFETDNSIHKRDQFLQEKSISEYIHINISASLKERFWPTEKWKQLVGKIASKDCMILISSDPSDSAIAEEIADTNRHCFRYPTNSFSDVISLVKAAKLVISPDTSIIHIAGAFNRPVIGLYANRPWNLKKFYPLSDKSKVVINQESDTFIDAITVDNVFSAFRKLEEEIA